jgi:hypothetical protein
MPSKQSRRERIEIVAGRATAAVDAAVSTARTLVSHVPATARAASVGARATASALQILPDTTLGGLAASSVGLGTGFYVAGMPRLATAAAIAPAMIIGAAIVLRPSSRVGAVETTP